jgi:MarR family transcriptional regulator for hemolysin
MSTPFADGSHEFARELGLVTVRWQQLIVERLKRFNLTEARWCALYWLSRAPEGLSQTALAEQAGVEAPALVRTLDILERQGLVRREPSKRDRRVNVVQLTDTGRSMVVEVKRQRDILRDAAMGGMTAEDYRTLVFLLRQMREGLDGLAESSVAAVA